MNVCSWPTGTSLSLWWKWRDISGFSFQGSFSISSKGYVHVHVLFDWAWSGLTGKYLARGPDVRTKRYAVDLHGWEKNIFLSDQTQSIGILLCDRFEKFCFNLIKTRQTGACGTTTKKILQKETFPLFFRVRTRRSQCIKKLFFFFAIFVFPWSFYKKAVFVQGWSALSGPALVNSCGPAHVSFQYGFPWDYAHGAAVVIW